ncbi:hypothetical protein QUW58_25595 [Enterocloster aldenensis]|uniref:hypothetical protein n=1 Tax=Enterocloster aldenensis TaxID=358742 RepID=UPI0025A40C58|nr:hypothetical protein [Enterocloster aldenensis]
MLSARTRRMQITCNHPLEKGFTADRIKEILLMYRTEYYCFCYETGEQGTEHFHLYIKFKNPQSTSILSKRFGNAHVEAIRNHSTSLQNRDYIRKEGAYLDSEKKATNHIETFYESGDCPTDGKENQGCRNDIEAMISLVQDGASNMEIVQAVPSMALRIPAVEQYRQAYWEEQGKEYRQMRVWYIYGKTRTGKTSYVYQSHDASEIYSVVDYKGTGIWDKYDTARTRVLLLDEYRSALPFSLILALCDGQPLTLNCRYANRVCLHDTVYIVSNIPLMEQYPNIQREEPDSWDAFLARINQVRHYYDIGKYRDYTVKEYLEMERYGTLSHGFEPCQSHDTPFGPEAPLHMP